MEVGAEGPANVLYTLYSPLCHQFAFRSWFLFGQQYSYPRAVAGSDQASFESFAASDPHFADVNLTRWTADLQLKSRSFKGNEEMGYKTALCERDMMIYAAMLLGGCSIPACVTGCARCRSGCTSFSAGSDRAGRLQPVAQLPAV